MSLQRIDRVYRGKPTHHYELDGERIPGVTSLLGDGLPKPALVRWASKSVAEYVADNTEAVRTMLDTMGRESIVGALKGVPWAARDAAAARGTEVHALAEAIIHGETVEVPEHLAGYVDGYVRWLDSWQVEVVQTEVTVCRRSRDGLPAYAGTYDADVRIGAGEYAGARALLDWKTSKGVYGDNGLQLAMYANADFALDADGTEQPIPDYDLLGVVHLTPTGADLYPVTDPDAAWRIARHVAYLAVHMPAIKSLIDQPTPAPLTTEDAA